jgi:hypothetical protein
MTRMMDDTRMPDEARMPDKASMPDEARMPRVAADTWADSLSPMTPGAVMSGEPPMPSKGEGDARYSSRENNNHQGPDDGHEPLRMQQLLQRPHLP